MVSPLVSPLSHELGGGRARAWDLSLIPHSSSLLGGCYHHVDISLPVKYYHLACLHIRALSTRTYISLISLIEAMACLLFILCVCLYDYFHLHILYAFVSSGSYPLLHIHLTQHTTTALARVQPLIYCLIAFCKAAGKQQADEETLNRLLAALCTLQAEWSHCK